MILPDGAIHGVGPFAAHGVLAFVLEFEPPFLAGLDPNLINNGQRCALSATRQQVTVSSRGVELSHCVGNLGDWGASPDHGLAIPLPGLHRVGRGLAVALLVGIEGREIFLWGRHGLDAPLLLRDGLVGRAQAKLQRLSAMPLNGFRQDDSAADTATAL